MIGRKVKRERATLRTAHDWLKNGHFFISPTDHFLSEAEHDALVGGIAEELEEVPKQFPRTQNLEFAVLKAHLIIEYVLTQYIRYQASVSITIEDIRFTFAQKLEIAYLMGFGANDPTLLPTIQLLNKARNQVAHHFNLDKGIVDEVIRINSEAGAAMPATDRQRISALRSICGFICGRTTGHMQAEHLSRR